MKTAKEILERFRNSDDETRLHIYMQYRDYREDFEKIVNREIEVELSLISENGDFSKKTYKNIARIKNGIKKLGENILTFLNSN